MSEKIPYENLTPMTIRISPHIDEVLNQIADRNDVSKAEVVRLALDNRLLDYVGKVQYVNPDQGKEIKKLLGQVSTEVQKIRMEINRIGINYNQAVKIKNIEKKYDRINSFEAKVHKEDEINKITAGIDCVTDEKLGKVLDQFESSISRLGDLKCLLV